jgi:hypothetical protein
MVKAWPRWVGLDYRKRCESSRLAEHGLPFSMRQLTLDNTRTPIVPNEEEALGGGQDVGIAFLSRS